MIDITPISLNQIISFSAAEFTDFELAVANGLSNVLSEAYNLDVDSVGVVVDIDYGNPMVKINGGDTASGDIDIGFSGRFYPHDVDKDGKDINNATWGDTIKAFFEENEIVVKLDADNLPIKFSFNLSCLTWETRETSGGGGGKAEGPDTEDDADADDDGDEAPADDQDAGDESADDGEDNLDDLLGEPDEESADEEPAEAPEPEAKPEE